MKRIVAISSLIAFLAVSTLSFAVDSSKLSKKKQTKLGLYMTSAEALHYVNRNAINTLFVDVRSRAEVNFLGAPTVIDANIPYMELSEWYAWNEKKKNFKLDVNSDFAKEVARRLKDKSLSKNDTVIVMCRSGSRSSKAANLLADLGYKRVISVIDGYEGDKAKEGKFKGQRVVNGWKNNGLPWSYKLDKSKMFVQK